MAAACISASLAAVISLSAKWRHNLEIRTRLKLLSVVCRVPGTSTGRGIPGAFQPGYIHLCLMVFLESAKFLT